MKLSRQLILETLLIVGNCPRCLSSQITFKPPSIGSEVIFKCHTCGWWDTVTWEEINQCGGKLPQSESN